MANRRLGVSPLLSAGALILESQAQTSAAKLRIRTTLLVLHEALEHSIHRAETLRTDVIPRLESALKDTRHAYEMGRYSYFEWRTVQSELIQARRELLEASIDSHTTSVEIERLTGVRVAFPGTEE